MRLTAKLVPYSGVVGGGLQLIDESGRAVFIVNFIGTGFGISKAQSEALARRLETLINADGILAPEFPPGSP